MEEEAEEEEAKQLLFSTLRPEEVTKINVKTSKRKNKVPDQSSKEEKRERGRKVFFKNLFL